MTDKIVTYEDRKAIAYLAWLIGPSVDADPKMMSAAADFLERAAVAAESDVPPLAEGWVLLNGEDGGIYPYWHMADRLYNGKGGNAYRIEATATSLRDRLTPLRPTIDAEALERAARAARARLRGVDDWDDASEYLVRGGPCRVQGRWDRGGGMKAHRSLAAPPVNVAGVMKASCVIRFDHPDGKTPIMLGGSHACVGVESAVFNQHGDLELMLGVKDPHRWKINSLHIQVDEQLAGIVTVGGSGGTARLRVRFHTLAGRRLYLNKSADRAVIWGHQRNIWYSAEWLDATTFTNGGQ